MTTFCVYSHEDVADDAAVLVGKIADGTGPPIPVHACRTCVLILDLLPMDEHPADTNGLPRRRDGHHVLATGSAPVMVQYGEWWSP
jgi:hypothetical protein